MAPVVNEEDLGEVFEGEQETSTYALQKDGHQLYPLLDRDSLTKAARHFVKHRSKYPYKWRKEIATNLLKKAEQLGMDLPHKEYMQKAAGQGVGNRDRISAHLRIRANKLPGLADDMKKLARDFKQAEQIGPEEASKAAEIMARVDEQSGLYREYGGDIDFPEEVAFEHTRDRIQKQADSMIKLANDSVITVGQLQKVSAHKVAAAIGGEVEEKVMDDLGSTETLIKLARELDADDADTLCLMLPEPEHMISFG